MLSAVNASLMYTDHGRPVYACQDVSLTVKDKEFLGILGPSGSGKSSLLYLLSGLKVPTSGEILFNEQNLAQLSDDERSQIRLKEFGFVFQQPYLLGYLSALENVLVSAPHDPDVNAAMALLEDLGIAHKSHRLPHELSGGERQRVCVARALLGRPRVVFADEPTAALDHKNGAATVKLLNRFRGKGALVMVTHDPAMLEEADRIVRLVDGQLVPDGK